MTNQITLNTPRLVLKSITPALIHHLFNHKTKKEITHYFNTNEDGYEHLKVMHEKGMETHRISLFYFLLIDKTTNKVIGECGYHSWNYTHQRAELFYGLKNDSDKRKGLMTEAVKEVLHYGFTNLSLHRIAALTANANMASLRILHNFGFTKEGTLREDYVVNNANEDSECFSLLKWEWEQKNKSRK